MLLVGNGKDYHKILLLHFVSTGYYIPEDFYEVNIIPTESPNFTVVMNQVGYIFVVFYSTCDGRI
jgi:hypothetical protein